MHYVIAQLRITDPERYGRYQARFADVLKGYDGTLLAADLAPELIEGVWTGHKVVLLSFPCAKAFRQWAESPAYREIARDRRAASEGSVLLVQGI
jgi:uncharacterized protein (DUF1330 family)